LEEGVPLLSQTSLMEQHAKRMEKKQNKDSPTLKKSKTMREAASSLVQGARGVTFPTQVFGKSHNQKLLNYDPDSLLTHSALMRFGCSVFVQKPVIYTLCACTFLAGLSALCVFNIPKASKLDTAKFDEFGGFLKFFIVFMLGIYVQQAFKRWWTTVTTFEMILIDIRQLHFMLHTISATPSCKKLIEGYCIASCYILNVEVQNAQFVDKKNHRDLQGLYSWLVAQGLLTEEEVLHLGKTSGNGGSPSGEVLSNTRAIWCWIAELMSHPEVEEGISVLPPLLARSIIMCQACVTDIEVLKMNITMQTPFMYAQLLAILVHVNNIILSVSCGMALGSSMNEFHRRGEQLAGERETSRRGVTVTEELYEAIQTLGTQLVIVLLSPMLYIAFLHIAHMLCYPFGDECYHLPTETLIARLHSELNHMSDNRNYARQKQLQKENKGNDKHGKNGAGDDDEDIDMDGDDDAS